VDTFIEQEELIKKKSFLLMVPLFALAGLLWAFVYYYYGARNSANIPAGYSVISLISLMIFRRYKNFNVFRETQLILILFLPALLHLSLGSFISSSAVILWSILCPLGALAFYNTKAASFYLLLFITVVVSAFFLENKLFPKETMLPEELVSIMFVLNITVVTFIAFLVLRYFVSLNEQIKAKLKQEQDLLSAEREKSEKLLLNILPPSIAKRLKDGERVIANEHKAVILFADIVGFTSISQQVTPARLVENLNKIFTHFDRLVEEQGLEKIKTIGDSYMVASGLTENENENINKMADLAITMTSDIEKFSLDDKNKCQLKIGIHMGQVIAGVIGSKKISYDIWGDAVNTASRMESFGEAGRIQVSEIYYEYIKDDYKFMYRGQVEIKGKGMMNLYFLVGKIKHLQN
jgi:guanylate cyclase